MSGAYRKVDPWREPRAKIREALWSAVGGALGAIAVVMIWHLSAPDPRDLPVGVRAVMRVSIAKAFAPRRRPFVGFPAWNECFLRMQEKTGCIGPVTGPLLPCDAPLVEFCKNLCGADDGR